ncbi:MAG: efflux RND transporter periplasmic adaptor subunit [Pseudomonadota bacterium]
MKNRARKWVIIVVAILAALVLLAYFLKRESIEAKLNAKPPQSAIQVEFAPIKSQEWGTQINQVGTIQSFSGITLRAQIAGRITAVHAQSGSNVKKGDKLFEINPKVIQAQLEEAQAALENSKFTFERMKELYAERTVSEQAFNQAQSAFNVDQARVRTSQQQLALATTYATFDGVMGVTEVQVGDEVGVNQELATLQSSERLRVEFPVPQKYAQLVSAQDSVTITSETNADDLIDATIFAVNPLVDSDTRSVEVRAEVPPHSFLPGSYVNVTLTLNDVEPVLTVPQTAVMHSLYGDTIYKVVNGKAVKTNVVPGTRRGGDIEVSGDLKAGDQVVSAGLRKVMDGAEVSDSVAQKAAAAAQTTATESGAVSSTGSTSDANGTTATGTATAADASSPSAEGSSQSADSSKQTGNSTPETADSDATTKTDTSDAN